MSDLINLIKQVSGPPVRKKLHQSRELRLLKFTAKKKKKRILRQSSRAKTAINYYTLTVIINCKGYYLQCLVFHIG